MQTKQTQLDPKVLERFVPFDELTPEGRVEIVQQTTILQFSAGEPIGETVLDPHHTLYLLAGELVLLAGDRLVDTLAGGSPIARFPLSRLRSGQLCAQAKTNVQLLRIERDLVSQLLKRALPSRAYRSALSPGTEPAPPNRPPVLAAIEALGPAIASSPSQTDFNPQRLSVELAQADAELGAALQDKAEATIARRLWASEFRGLETPADGSRAIPLEQQIPNILAEQARLAERSRKASQALAAAERKKLELEAALYSLETSGTQEHAEAEARWEQLCNQAAAKLCDEEQQLEAEYARAAQKVAREREQLEQARQAAERTFQQERERLEAEFTSARERLEREMVRIQSALETARKKARERTEALQTAHTSAQHRVRVEVEAKLRRERKRLKAELDANVIALKAAQNEVDAARAGKRAAEEETRRLTAQLKTRDEIEHAENDRPYPPRPLPMRDANPKVNHQASAAALGAVSPTGTNPQRPDSRNKTASADRLTDDHHEAMAECLHADLESIRHKLAQADQRLAAATRVRATAVLAKYKIEERVARHRAVEDEIRLELHEETEVRIPLKSATHSSGRLPPSPG